MTQIQIVIRRKCNFFHRESLGIHLQLKHEGSGQVVTFIEKGSVVARDGQMKIGDELLSVNGKCIGPYSKVSELIGNDTTLVFTLQRQGSAVSEAEGAIVQGSPQVGVIVNDNAQVGTPMQTQGVNAPHQIQSGPMQVPFQQTQHAPPHYAPQCAATAPQVSNPPAIVYQQQPAVMYSAPAPTTIIYDNRPPYPSYGYGGGYGRNFGGTDPLLAGGLGFGAGLLAGEMLGGGFGGGNDITVINNGFGDTTIIDDGFW